MNNIENTPRREDAIPAQTQDGKQNTNKQAQQNTQNQGQQGQQHHSQGQQGQDSNAKQQQGGNQQNNEQADQSSTYRGQDGQEYDVDASDAINHQADYSGNSERDIDETSQETPEVVPEIEDASADEDRDMVSQHDSDQNINPGDKAPNKDFNR